MNLCHPTQAAEFILKLGTLNILVEINESKNGNLKYKISCLYATAASAFI